MAAALPAINSAGMNRKSPSITQHQIMTPHSRNSTKSLFSAQPVKRGQSKKDRELENKKLLLRAQQPMLQKWQTIQYRNSYKHNLCLDMLQEGYHRSFTELFKLIQQQNEERDRAGPESTMWSQAQLENEPDKLEMLKAYLTKAEQAHRKDNFQDVYACKYKLARYFQKTGDKWLSDHFFELCLASTKNITSDGGKTAAEAHCNVGLALEDGGENFDAAINFETCYELTRGKSDWLQSDDKPMDIEACNNLCRIYTTIATDLHSQGDLKQYLNYLKKAYDMAKEGGEKPLLGLASYRLGLAYEKNKDSETALLYLNGYLDICQTLGDSEGTGKACEAIAKSYETQGRVEESIKYLEMFVEVAEHSKNDKAISRACSDLGAMFNSLGRYDQAVEYFNKSYNIARAMNDTETISSSRVLFGVAAAHKMLESVASHINHGTKTCIERLMEWKDNRGDEFDKTIPEAEIAEQKLKEEKKE